MSALKPLDGLRFGRLLVMAREATKHGHATWLCRCDCGAKPIVLGNHLRSGLTTSCGCFKRESACLPTGEAAFNAVWYNIKYSAQRRGIGFHLSKASARQLLTSPCHYCGQGPSQGNGVAAGKQLNGNFIYNGIDRIDNSRDYTEDNVVPCCGVCNKAKLAMTTEEFRAWVAMVYKHFCR